MGLVWLLLYAVSFRSGLGSRYSRATVLLLSFFSTIQFIVHGDCKLWRNQREMLSSWVCQGHRWHLFNQNNILDCTNNALRSPSTWGLRCSVTMSDDSRWRIWTHLYSSHSLIDILKCFSDNLFLNAHTVHFLINHVISCYIIPCFHINIYSSDTIASCPCTQIYIFI